jgi:hypothetical protein
MDHIRRICNKPCTAARRALFPKYKDLISSNCPHSAAIMKSYCAGLVETGIPINRTLSASEYAERAVALKWQDLDSTCTFDADQTCAVIRGKGTKKEVAELVIGICTGIKPCCLDCTRKDICGEKDVFCHMGHDATAHSNRDNNS